MTLGEVFEVGLAEFFFREFGMTVPQSVGEETSAELCQFESFTKALVGGHAPQDLNINLMMRVRFRIHLG